MTIVEMKKQSLSWELNSSVHEDERSVGKADDSVGRGKGRLSRTHVLHRSRRVLLGGVLEATGKDKEIAPYLLA